MSDCTKNNCKCSGENAENDTKIEDKDIAQEQSTELDKSSLDDVVGGFAPKHGFESGYRMPKLS